MPNIFISTATSPLHFLERINMYICCSFCSFYSYFSGYLRMKSVFFDRFLLSLSSFNSSLFFLFVRFSQWYFFALNSKQKNCKQTRAKKREQIWMNRTMLLFVDMIISFFIRPECWGNKQKIESTSSSSSAILLDLKKTSEIKTKWV